uniref:Uncharacterized protein n=1 Tax=Anopheles maculatus TaxID=74869 RepID=A0A182SEY4_9DIPT
MNYKFDTSDLTRRLKRTFDVNLSYRKLFLLLFVVAVFLLYIGPSFLRWLFGHTEPMRDQPMRCMDDRLTPFYLQNLEYNPIHFHPIVSVASSGQPAREATVVEYLTGIVHRFQCFPDGYHVSYQYYAHRTMPSVLVQEIQLTNTKNQLTDIELIIPRISDWPSAIVKNVKLQHGSAILEYQVVTGMIDMLPTAGNAEDNKVRVVSIVARKLPRVITLKKRGTTKLELLLTVNYSEPIARDKYAAQKESTEKQAIEAMNRALLAAEHGEHNAYHNFKRDHILVWNNLWETGFHISTSKAENTLNGNNINATMYAVISQARAYEFEQSVTTARKEEIARSLTYAEGCYDSYHTLQAENLWRPMA